MPELMLISNPRKRRKARKTKAKKHTKRKRRMSALQRKYFGKRRTRRRIHSRKRNTGVTLMANPRKRRRKSRRMSYKRSAGKRGMNFNSFTKDTIMPSAIGAAGALGLDVIMGYLPIPANLKTGAMLPVVKIGGAIGIGMLAGMFMPRKTAEQVTAGAITVALYDTLKGIMQQSMPNVQLSSAQEEDFTDIVMDTYPELAYAGAAETVGAYMGEDLGEYVSSGNTVGEYVGE